MSTEETKKELKALRAELRNVERLQAEEYTLYHQHAVASIKAQIKALQPQAKAQKAKEPEPRTL